jgi:hypothetical protein
MHWQQIVVEEVALRFGKLVHAQLVVCAQIVLMLKYQIALVLVVV